MKQLDVSLRELAQRAEASWQASAAVRRIAARQTDEPTTGEQPRVEALAHIAQHHGLEIDRSALLQQLNGALPSAGFLVEAARTAGLWATAASLRWRHITRVRPEAPLILLLAGGGAAEVVAYDRKHDVVLLADPLRPGREPYPIDQLRLSRQWDGEVLLVRRNRTAATEEEPFSFWSVARLVLGERRSLRDILVASVSVSLLQILPPFLIMVAIDRVLTHQAVSTLVLLALMLGIATLYDALLGYARREVIEVTSTRIDARLALHVFRRLVALPVEFFERNPTGEVTHRISEVFKIRDFMTGKLVGALLDTLTLVVLLPFLFWMSLPLAAMVVAAAVAVALVILAFMPLIRRVYGRLIAAENRKGAVLVETVHGMRTVKSLGIERMRADDWDARVAEAGRARLDAGRLSNLAQTIVSPLESFINRGVILLGAYIVITAPPSAAGITAGALVAFSMLGSRVAMPLIGLAKLLQDIEQVRASVQQVSQVLNHPTETAAMQSGLRRKIEGGVTFQDVTFTYPGAKVPALDRVSFDAPAGTMLGLVGRSGSGKSTIARLLQGLNREYAGSVKIDGNDLREINLAHLRRSFGVVMQDNFLFRGTVRECILAGRPGLTLEHAMRAARLAGAEEFIERLPRGYETWIEEGSANLSGGQRQRLAIARALVADPALLILDEATSALDPESEALVNANLRSMASGRTMVIVSHRLSSLTDCDRIVVMDKGRVADCASHEVLLDRCDIYRQLWQQQNRHVEAHRVAALRPVSGGVAG